MCLSTAYKIEKKPENELMRNVMLVSTDHGVVTLTDIMGKSSRLLCFGKGSVQLAKEAFRQEASPVGESGLPLPRPGAHREKASNAGLFFLTVISRIS